jgi:large subunit ribosomal protein L24
MKLKKNDKVKITAGKDKGREGIVEKVFPKKGKILVTGINMYKKHAKKRTERGSSGIIDIAKPLSVANMALICPKCGKVTRVGYQIDKSGTKVRICKKCKEII